MAVSAKDFHGCCSERLHHALCLQVFLELQQQIGFVPTLQMYNILIDSYSRGLKWRKCLEVCDWSFEIEIPVLVTKYECLYGRIVDVSNLCSLWAGFQVLGCIKKDILEPNWKTYEPILSCLSQLELWETYLEIYGEVLAQGYSLKRSPSLPSISVKRTKDSSSMPLLSISVHFYEDQWTLLTSVRY